MKKTKKTALTAALFAAAMTMTGCPGNPVQTVYGPPPTNEMTEAPTEATTEAPTEAPTVAATEAPTEAPVTETFRPEEEEPQDLYGPPVGEDEPEIEPAEEPDTYRPHDEMPAPVYGPPQ